MKGDGMTDINHQIGPHMRWKPLDTDLAQGVSGYWQRPSPAGAGLSLEFAADDE